MPRSDCAEGEETVKSFKINNGKGFFITFPNGVRLSTQFSWANYCENNRTGLSWREEIAKNDWESNDAEIAILDKDNNWLTNEFEGDDDVLGHTGIKKWLKAFDFARNYKHKRKKIAPKRESK
jgi:hypothetical protein